SPADDDVLTAARDEQVAVLVEAAAVPRAQPTVGADGTIVVGADVARRQRRAAHQQFAGLPNRDIAAAVVNDPQLDAGQRLTDRPRPTPTGQHILDALDGDAAEGLGLA